MVARETIPVHAHTILKASGGCLPRHERWCRCRAGRADAAPGRSASDSASSRPATCPAVGRDNGRLGKGGGPF